MAAIRKVSDSWKERTYGWLRKRTSKSVFKMPRKEKKKKAVTIMQTKMNTLMSENKKTNSKQNEMNE